LLYENQTPQRADFGPHAAQRVSVKIEKRKDGGNMEYPKQVMRLRELEAMGIPESFLMDAYRSKNQRFAWKLDMTKKNSPILFDTSGFEEYRMSLIKNEQEANRRNRRVC
jgi:hypothetical protein